MKIYLPVNVWGNLASRTLLAAAIGLALGASTAHASIYTFDDLTAAAGGTEIIDQDGWAGLNTGRTGVYLATERGVAPNNTSGMVLSGTTTTDNQIWRTNDSNFSFSLSQTGPVTLQFDMRPTLARNSLFGLIAFDGDGDRVGGGNPIFSFGFDSHETGYKIRRYDGNRSDGAALEQETTGGTWTDQHLIRVKLDLDPTANSFDGSATLSATNLTLADGQWLTLISDFNTELTDYVDGYRTPDTWNTMWVRTHGTTTSIDNLTVIPEPLSISLLMGGICGFFLLRRRRR